MILNYCILLIVAKIVDSIKTDLTDLMKVYKKQCQKLSKLDSTQGNESFNKSVASKAPKSHFYSGTSSLNVRVAASVAQKNDGQYYLIKVNNNIGLSPGVHTKRLAILRDLQARKRRAISITRKEKIRRIQLRNRRVKRNAVKEMCEGTSHSCEIDLQDHQDIVEIPSAPVPPEGHCNIPNTAKVICFDLETTSLGSNEYIGCFVDTLTTRLLPHHYKLNGNNPPDMENNLCLLYCKNQRYMYSGTQSGRECWCGDDPYQYGPADASCNYKCFGDVEQICGGPYRLSVYETGYLPLAEGQIQFQLFSNSTILTAPSNQVLTSRSKFECALYCKISDNCTVFVISTETGQCSLYYSYISMCAGVQYVQGFQVYMMK